jgi:hypothetical protein
MGVRKLIALSLFPLVVAVGFAFGAPAHADVAEISDRGSERVSRSRGFPAFSERIESLNWSALAGCEAGGRPKAIGGGGAYHGMYQFTVGTWKSVGGKGLPSKATAAEQTYRAKLLYQRSGAGPWPNCGKKLKPGQR